MNNDYVSLRVDDVAPVEVGPGCVRRDLPSNPGVHVWVIDIAPGMRWPYPDHHHLGEEYLVVSGEIIEGDRRIGAGNYVTFVAGTTHQPHTEIGVRLFGFNLGDRRRAGD